MIPSPILLQLSTIGITTARLADALGCGVREASRILKAHGAVNHGGRWLAAGVALPPWGVGGDRACVKSEGTGIAFGHARDAV